MADDRGRSKETRDPAERDEYATRTSAADFRQNSRETWDAGDQTGYFNAAESTRELISRRSRSTRNKKKKKKKERKREERSWTKE